jgi:dinuclear metal center YbgI/SA1388 family protein
VEEAIAKGCNLIISHHPILFKGLKRLNGSNYVERTLILAIQNNIALYALHTNLDNIHTGVNQKIADRIGLIHTRILQPKIQQLMKLTFFAPRDQAGEVRDALFAEGAGIIGNYSGCSFNSEGLGTFVPEQGSNPTIGKIGTIHEEPETRVEMMFPGYLQKKVLNALFSAHPYEEVAYYLHELSNPNQYIGSGMIGELKDEMPFMAFLQHLKDSMKVQFIRHTGMVKENIRRVALCGGSGSFLLASARKAGADIFITGDFKYHDFFNAENDLVIADIGHYESEQFTIDLIADKVRRKFTTFATHLTEVNTNPIHFF